MAFWLREVKSELFETLETSLSFETDDLDTFFTRAKANSNGKGRSLYLQVACLTIRVAHDF